MFYTSPDLKKVHVLFVYYDFQAGNAYSHVGLGVNAMHALRVLRRKHIRADAIGVRTTEEIEAYIKGNPTVTHCIVEAPWISTERLTRMLANNQSVHFIIRSHSQIGFLQVEAGAVKLLREQLVLQENVQNLTISANSQKLCDFFTTVYSGRCLYLPNLYDMERVHTKRDTHHHHRELRIGSFGALRLLKNHTTAAAAALVMARERNANLEFWISVNREEHGKGVLQTVRNMFVGLPWAKLVESPWQQWADFRRTVHHMDLCLQVSFTETFNIVTADAIAEGVPSVVSSAIEWAPDSWKADVDTVEDIARVGSMLLSSHSGVLEGQRALQTFTQEAINTWLQYLSSNPADILPA